MASESRGVHMRQNDPDTLRAADRERVPRGEVRQPESLDALARRVAHDVNNQLAVIISFATLVADDVGAARRNGCTQLDNASAAIAKVLTAAQRGAELTGQLLSFRTPPVTSGDDAHGHAGRRRA